MFFTKGAYKLKQLFNQYFIKTRGLIPGLILLFLMALIIYIFFPTGIWVFSPLLLIILGGLCIANTIGVKPIFKLGISFTVKKLLKLAIILLGVRFSITELLNLPLQLILIIIICMLGAALITYFLAKLLRLEGKLTVLIAIGTAICGNSAIMASAPIIDAEEKDVTVAVSIITLFGTLALFAFPLIGSFLELSNDFFGFWSGIAIHDTSQVIAAGFAFSELAGESAAVVKMMRNLLMIPLLSGLAFYCARQKQKEEACQVSYFDVFPWFVFGFIIMSSARSLDIFSEATIDFLSQVSAFLILMVLGGVGLNTKVEQVKKMGLKAFVIGLAAALVIASLSYYLLSTWVY